MKLLLFLLTHLWDFNPSQKFKYLIALLLQPRHLPVDMWMWLIGHLSRLLSLDLTFWVLMHACIRDVNLIHVTELSHQIWGKCLFCGADGTFFETSILTNSSEHDIKVSRRRMPTFETNLLSFCFVNRMENKSVRAVHHLRAFLQKPVCECLVFGHREGERENSQYVKLLATS